MTESTATAAAPRLERPRDSAFRGVCSAVARMTGTDPILWRVLAAVLTLFNGLGILLYVAGMVAIPAEGEPRSLAEKLLKGPDRRLTREQGILIAILVVVAVGYLGDPSDVIVVAVGALLGLVWWRQSHDPDAAPSPMVAAATAPPPPLDYAQLPVWTPPPPRPRSPLGGVTVALTAIVAGVLVLVGVSGPSVPAEVVLAAALGVVGLGLVVGSFWGRSWGLWLLATGLGLSLVGTLAVRPIIDHGVGERTWTPTGSGSYQLGIGEGTLDLAALREPADITAHLTIGHLLVLVPEGVGVDLDATATTGAVEVFGKEENGRRPAQHVVVEPAPGKPTITLDLSIRTGFVEVRRA